MRTGVKQYRGSGRAANDKTCAKCSDSVLNFTYSRVIERQRW